MAGLLLKQGISLHIKVSPTQLCLSKFDRHTDEKQLRKWLQCLKIFLTQLLYLILCQNFGLMNHRMI